MSVINSLILLPLSYRFATIMYFVGCVVSQQKIKAILYSSRQHPLSEQRKIGKDKSDL